MATAVMITKVVSSSKRQKKAEERCQELEIELDSLRQTVQKKQKEKPNKENSRTGQSNVLRDPRKEQAPTIEEETSTDGGLLVKRIGTIRSIYRLCVGTPRQGLLAPNARGCIELEKLGNSSSAESVSGLEGYSHIWVLFVFHLNTTSRNSKKRIKSKIAPPALGGKKVGIFATRTPHRFNPIGITLCKLDRIQKVKHNKKEKIMLHVSGLDLVDGTPVLDVKPYVPIYDSVPMDVKLPPWVAGGLATKRNVIFQQNAKDELYAILEQDKNALQFYGESYGEKSVEETMHCMIECIKQVLAIDVRSSFQTQKAREGKFQAERAKRLQNVSTGLAKNICTQQLDNLLIQYTVEETTDHKRLSSEGSGAEDVVSVTSIQLLERTAKVMP
jgi:tRNA-Thr(GGU) m(6)t(6)A37 methyltransferase TsaA